MNQGFYNLASGMLTQSRILNNVSNNITNIATPGFKRDYLTTSTFRDMLVYRIGNTDKSSAAYLGGSQSMIRTYDVVVTDFSQGAYTETGRKFDFMLYGSGFFQIQTDEGMVYTRNGSFTLDDEGYLSLQGIGRVMGSSGPIQLGTDKFTVDREGDILLDAGGTAGRILVVDFAEEDYASLRRYGEGMWVTDAAQIINPAETTVMWQMLEDSNVEIMNEMVDMITAQRAFQSGAQLMKMYDTLNSKTVTDIARIV